MKKIALLVTLFISLLMLSGCSSSFEDSRIAQPELSAKPERMTVAYSAEAVKVLPAFTTFTWHEGYSAVLAVKNKQQAAAAQAYIKQQLITYLQTKGYRYQADPAQAEMVIGFLFAVNDARANKSIYSRFGTVPGMTQAAYKKGSFLLTVLDSELQKVYWRAALQGYGDLETESNAANSAPMQKILDIMLGGFPKAGR